jgi:hypothetical protein
MRDLSNIMNSLTENGRPDYWMVYAVASVVICSIVWLFCPVFAVQPHIGSYWFFFTATLVILTIPFSWSIYLLFAYRTKRERTVAHLSLATSVVFLLGAQQLCYDVLKFLIIYGR